MNEITEQEYREALQIPAYRLANLQDVQGQLDRLRDELVLLVNPDERNVVLSLYEELTAVADRMYQVAYQRRMSEHGLGR